MRVYSTSVTRAIMSAAANLAGIFSTEENAVLNDDIMKEQTAKIIVSDKTNGILLPNIKCPLKEQLYADYLKTDYAREMFEKFEKTFDYVSKHCGLNVRNVKWATAILDTFKIEILRNYT